MGDAGGKINFLDKILKSRKKATLTGPVGHLKSLEDALLSYLSKLRDQGINVNTCIVVLRALFLSPKFHMKSFIARCSAVKCFFVAHLFAYRMGTHTSQRVPAEVESKVLNFMLFMRRIVFGANRNRHFFSNMDQMPVYFLMNTKRMLELIEKNKPHSHVDGRHEAGDRGDNDLCRWHSTPVNACL